MRALLNMCNSISNTTPPVALGGPTASESGGTTPTWLQYPIDELLENWQRIAKGSSMAFTLENDIHPLFAEKQFLFDKLHYNALLPALQLASLFIDTPEIMDYWYAAFLSTPQEVSYIDREGTYKAIFRKGSPLSKRDVREIRACFRAMVPIIRFAPAQNGVRVSYCASNMIKLTQRTPLGKNTKLQWNGNGSIIHIGDEALHSVFTTFQAATADPTPKNCQRLSEVYFTLAKTVLHELAHAVRNARWGESDGKQKPFEDQIISEDGFDWETTVFGGIMMNEKGQSSPLMLSWPDSCIAACYVTRNSDLAVMASWDTVLSRLDCGMWWRVSPAWISTLFRKEFWEESVPARGAEALKHPKVLGVRNARTLLGVASLAMCSCPQCVAFDEKALRFCLRGDGPHLPAGACLPQVKKKGKAKLVSAPEEHRNYTDMAKSEGRVLIPASDREFGIQPTPPCPLQNGWSAWYGATNPSDKRDAATFGLPAGTKSLADGSVVASEHFDTVAAWESQRDEQAKATPSASTGTEVGRVDILEGKRRIIAHLLVRLADCESSIVQDLDLVTLCAIMRAHEKRDEMLAWCEKSLGVRLLLDKH